MDVFKSFPERYVSEIEQLGSIVTAVGLIVLCCFLLWLCCQGICSNSDDQENEFGLTLSRISEKAGNSTIHFENEIKNTSFVQPKDDTGTISTNSKFNDLSAEIIPDSPRQPKTADLKRDPTYLPEKDIVTIQSIDGSNHQISKSQKVVIAVDASGQGFGGYCVIQDKKVVMYYSVKHDELPAVFRVRNLQDSGELEMRNLLFALWIFQSFLRDAKLFLYTDNPTIYSTTNKFVEDVDNYLFMLENEYNVFLANEESCFVDSHDEPKKFQKLIIPADMLSRGKLQGFLHRMAKQYPEMNLQRLGL